jgi:hypothetical protein
MTASDDKLTSARCAARCICTSSLFVCFWLSSLQWARAFSFTRFLDHTQRRTTVGRTPPDTAFTYLTVNKTYIAFSCKCLSEYLSRHSDSLRDGWSRDRIPVKARFSVPSRPATRPNQPSGAMGTRSI